MNEAKQKETSGLIGIMKALVLGVVLIAVFILILSAIFYIFKINQKYISVAYGCALYITAFLIGMKAIGSSVSKGYVKGGIAGLIFAIIVMLFSIFLNKTPITSTLVSSLIVILISVSGGIIGVNSK